MGIHDSFVDLADRLISKHGRTVTLTNPSETSDAVERWKIDATSTATASRKAVFFQNEQADLLAVLTQVAGRGDQEVTDLLGSTSGQVMIAAKGLAFIPTTQTTLTDGDVVREILSAKTIQPGDTPIVHFMKVSP